jgi:cytoskeleton protein RodZ
MDPTQQGTDALVKPATAGVLLRRAREAQGLHIAALAVTLKVPVRKLEALESDQHEAVGDSVFTRALAASVCRVLKTDPTAILAALPHTRIPRFKTDDSGLNTPFRTGGAISGQQVKTRLTSPMGLAVVLLLLGILLLVMLPASDLSDLAPTSATPASETEVLRAVPTVGPAATPAPQAGELPGTQNSSAVLQTSPVPTSNEAPAILMLESRGASWVEITDAQGVLQLRKILGAGDQVRSQGPLPLSVVLGRADDVTVSVRGQRLDVTAMTKANVARFEVK